jgi:hypothetical protein
MAPAQLSGGNGWRRKPADFKKQIKYGNKRIFNLLIT